MISGPLYAFASHVAKAGMALVCGPSISADNVIDLTGLDDDEISLSTALSRSNLPARPLSARQNSVIDIPQSNHGLKLAEAFDQQVAGHKRGTPKTSEGPSKRQRVDTGTRVGTGSPAPAHFAGEAFFTRHHPDLSRGENLKDVLRLQLFPHINRCLKPYRPQLDDGTRKRIGVTVAKALCNDRSFTDHVRQHKGNLAADFEKEVEARCKTLTDKLAGRALNKSRKTRSKVPPRLENGGVGRSEEEQQLVISVDSSEDDMEAPCGSAISKTLPAQSRRKDKSLAAASFSVDALCEKPRKASRESGATPRQESASSVVINGALTPSVQDLPTTSQPQSEQRFRERSNKKVNGGHSKKLYEPDTAASTAASTAAILDIERLRLSGCDRNFRRPYVSAQSRRDIRRGLALYTARRLNKSSKEELRSAIGQVIHVNFTQDEVRSLGTLIESASQSMPGKPSIEPTANLLSLIMGRQADITLLVGLLKGEYPLPGRTRSDVIAFLQDFAFERQLKQQQRVLRLQLRSYHPNKAIRAANSIGSVLLCREVEERRYSHAGYETSSIKNILASEVEDTLTRVAEWTDCSGDTCSMAWIPGERFVCGAITHSDSHNQQYNKPGNLMVGSVSNKVLTSIPGHRIPRPIISTGENSSAAMRETQDPWLYCTVTSAAYDRFSQRCFTSSYDQTVKVWQIDSDGASMDLCGVWEHSGVVNFVITSPWHAHIATASDFGQDAIRVYDIDEKNISGSAYCTFSGERANEQFLQPGTTVKTWAYYPATLQWGKAASVAHLLLAGYSPRSYDANAIDVPEDKLNTGELCLWNTKDGTSILITSARTANVFEVLWHPTQPIFFASTSATGEFGDGVKTQVRLFGQTGLGTFSHIKILDCPGSDINEITCMPNSTLHCYVTASCTDRNTYVWDTSQDDKPIHVLSHSASIENHGYDSICEDNGVKFAAWGCNVNRFYTGSSDGVVKAWDVRANPGEEFVQDVITLSGGISQGLFSPDCSKLLLGDTTGKVHLLSVESSLEPGEIRTPVTRNPIMPHSEPPPPKVDENDRGICSGPTARELAQAYIDRRQIQLMEDEYVGAVKGPEYASTGLFCPPEQQNPNWREDFEERHQLKKIKFSRLPILEPSPSLQHDKNCIQDLKIENLARTTHSLLKAERCDFNFEVDFDFDLEPESNILAEEKDQIESKKNCHFLEQLEIEEFQNLQQKICQELRIQNQMENFKIRSLETNIK